MDIDFSGLIPKNLDKLSEHITTYTDLYIKPIQSYKKAFSQRKNSLNFLSLHAIYYTLILLLVSFDLRNVLSVVALEILSTIYPLAQLIIPFYLFKHFLNKKKTWINLFRVLLLIKFQNTPVLLLLVILAKKLDEDFLYIVIDNWIITILIVFVIAIPITISNIKLWQRVLWGFANYFSLLIVSGGLMLLVERLNITENIFRKIETFSPSKEYYSQSGLDSMSISKFRDDRYLIILDTTTWKLRNTQFVTNDLYITLLTKSYNQTRQELLIQDSLLSIKDPNRPRQLLDKKIIEEKVLVSLKSLDSLKEMFNRQVYHDQSLFKTQKDSARFKMNKEYATLRYDYLKHMDSIYTNPYTTHNLIKNSQIDYRVDLDSGKVAIVFKIDSIKAYARKKVIIEKKENIYKFLDRSDFLLDIYIYPINLLLDLWEKDDE